MGGTLYYETTVEVELDEVIESIENDDLLAEVQRRRLDIRGHGFPIAEFVERLSFAINEIQAGRATYARHYLEHIREELIRLDRKAAERYVGRLIKERA